MKANTVAKFIADLKANPSAHGRQKSAAAFFVKKGRIILRNVNGEVEREFLFGNRVRRDEICRRWEKEIENLPGRYYIEVRQ